MHVSRYSLLKHTRAFFPRSLVGNIFAYTLVVRLALFLFQSIAGHFGASALSKHFDGLAIALDCAWVIFGSILLVRWVRHRLMWKLRNRLIVTFIFIAVIPIVLILGMGAIAGYLFANQYATTQVRSDFEAELRKLQAINVSARGEGDQLAVHRRLHAEFPDVSVAFYDAATRSRMPSSDADLPDRLPAWVKPGFKGTVSDQHQLYLRSVEASKTGDLTLTSQLVTPRMLNDALGDNGQLHLFLFLEVVQKNGHLEPAKPRSVNPRVEFSGGAVPPHSMFAWDPEITLGTLSPVPDWDSGKSYPVFLQLVTRPSRLITRLFSNLSDLAVTVISALIAIAVFFTLIEIGALALGISLTRYITGSIANLYRATQHINRGDLHHRIAVRNKDQLAELQSAFNSMTANLEKLIAEQKEKERLESEIAIAQEVQKTLFPHEPKPMRTLELSGICRPARSVSGDYYDFIPLGEERLGIALGDISGKGISAALLMATLHSAVRVYEYGGIPARRQLAHSEAAMRAATGSVVTSSVSTAGGGLNSPAFIMELLNRHLYFSTQPEKYATLFLGVYDGAERELTYCNAGHLPPIIVGGDGSVRRLELGGMVIGLFDRLTFDEQTVHLAPGDLFVAFSDGITEPENEFGEFGEDRLIEILRAHRRSPLPEISTAVLEAVQDWIGAAEQPDDVTLVLARAR